MDYSKDTANGVAASSDVVNSDQAYDATAAHADAAAVVAQAAARGSGGGVMRVRPGADGAVTLPANVDLQAIAVDGRDLVVRLPDGSVLVIVGGAANPPELVIGDVIVPRATVAALISDQETEPAAGPAASSGGNFAVPVGDIGDGFDLTALLPPTELAFGSTTTEEVFPAPNREPEVVIITPDNPTGVINAVSAVHEAGLPARGSEPPGSNSAADTETTTGVISFTAGDGVTTVSLDGVAITGVGQTFPTTFGVLTITSIAPGAIGYSFTLTDNTLNGSSITYTVTVTDSDGDTATATLQINVVDDVPTARPDTDDAPGGVATGNVMTGEGTTSGATGADTQGADGATVTAVSGAGGAASGAATLVVQGQYGELTLNADGSYTYVRAPGTPGGVNDVFTYTLTDGDGDTSQATLTITLSNAPPVISGLTPQAQGGDVAVNEANLAGGTSPNAGALTQAGTFTIAAPDGVASLTVGGVSVISGGVFAPVAITTPQGNTLSVTAYDPATGVVSYTYTLTANEAHAAGGGANSLFESLPVVLTDADGDVATDDLVARIVDDLPSAANDAAGIAAGGTSASGNVLANDVRGADGATVTAVSGAGGSAVGGGPLVVQGQYGQLTLNADGSYSYVRAGGSPGGVSDVFTYTLTDGDGDISTATLTISIAAAPPPQNPPTVGAPGVIVLREDDLDDGSSPDAAALTQQGSVTFTAGSSAITSIVFSTDLSGLAADSNGAEAGGAIVWTRVSDTEIIGQIDGVTAVTLTLTPPALPVGGSGTATVTAVLSAGFENALGADSLNLGGVKVVATSGTGSVTGTVNLTVIDDTPTARDDLEVMAAGDFGPATGNVITGEGTASGDVGADTEGADGASVAGVRLGSAGDFTAVAAGGVTISGAYGELTINPDGSYSYLRNADSPGDVSDIFEYQLVDGDGDVSVASLTISIGDAPVLLNVPKTGDAGTSVAEAGLPARGGEPEGSNAASDSETTAGVITYSAPDAPASITINGVEVTHVGQTFAGAHGTLTITSLSTGSIGYSYTLADNTSGDATQDDFAVVVTDADNDSSSGTLVIDIVDDVPTARPDTDLAPNDGSAATGNVLTGEGTTSGAAGADTEGADGATVTGVRLGAGGDFTAVTGGGVTINGAYGQLTINPDGSYSYVRDPGNPGNVSDVFNYQLTDGDGDVSVTSLTININDSGTSLNVPTSGQAGTSVSEAGLPARGGEPEGSDAASNSETTAGVITYTAPDGPAVVTIGGVAVTAVGQTFVGAHGTLTITSMGPGSIGYSYTLADNTNGDATHDDFAVVVTDADGDFSSGTLVIDIVDDVPTARADTDTVDNGDPATGNVITGVGTTSGPAGADTEGADGAAVTGIRAGGVGPFTAVGAGVTINGAHGTLTINPDGSYTYTADPNAPGGAADVFHYQLTDGDGDVSATTLTINHVDHQPVAGNVNVQLDDDALPGGNPGGPGDVDPDTANTSGFLPGSGGDGALTFALLTTGAPAGFTYEASGADLLVKQNGTLVATVTLDPATGAYTVTQNAPVMHAVGGGENNLAFTIGYTVTDVDGDPATGSINVSVNDDTSVLGAFTNATVVNAPNAITNGTFSFSAGADGWDSFAVTGPDLPGVTYSTTALANGTKLVASGGGATLFELSVFNDGTYSFQLITPDAGSTESFSLLNLTAGGPQPWTQTPDGRIEFTGSDNGVNSSTQGFGVNNQFVGVGQSFTMEFHNPGAPGDQAPGTDPYFVDKVVLSNNNINGSLTIQWTAVNTETGQTRTGTTAVTGSSTLIDPDISFNQLTVTGISGSGQGVRFSSVDITKTILPQDQLLNFTVTATDRDGDTTAAQNFTVHVNAGAPPVVLDLDGDGLEFVGHAAGVAYDYNGDGVKSATAWIGKDDGLLVFDEDGDGRVSSAREFVFTSRGFGGATDLEALRIEFDTDGDGKLTAADARFASFGVWQDLNGDGVSQPGEFKTLAELGIVSIDLVSDGKAYSAADGQVRVHGEATFTRADGTTGVVGDVAFATASDPLRSGEARTATTSAGHTGTLVAAALLASLDPALAAAQTSQPEPANDSFAASSQAAAPDAQLEPEAHVSGHAPAATDGEGGQASASALGGDEDAGASTTSIEPASAAHASAQPTPYGDTELDAGEASAGDAGFLDASAIPVAALAAKPAGEPVVEQDHLVDEVVADALGGEAVIAELLDGLPVDEATDGSNIADLSAVDSLAVASVADATLGLVNGLGDMAAHDSVTFTSHS